MPDILLFTFAVDLLFFPILLPVPMPICFIATLALMLVSRRKIDKHSMSWSILGILAVALSYFNGIYDYLPNNELAAERLENTGIILFMLASYPFVKSNIGINFERILKVLVVYIYFVGFLALIFLITPELYFQLRPIWSYGDSVEQFSSLSILTRYTGIMSDPNNLAVSTCAIAASILFIDSSNVIKNISIILVTSIVVIASMSTTGFLCLIIVSVSYIFTAPMSPKQKSVLFLVSFISITMLLFVVSRTEVFQVAYERFMMSDADSRFSRWEKVLYLDNWVKTVLIGDGGTIVLQGQDYRPHNGHLHVLLSFGILAYIAFVSLFFKLKNYRKWKRYIFLVVLFIGFTVNVGIYEYRFAGIWVILMSLYDVLDYKAASSPIIEERDSNRGVSSH
tara:strand:+ start:34057 stop:35241 length:1185 start_codon:yes stop_codon:yes gene_type:complete